MDRRRLADIRAGTVTNVQTSGSGYLVGPHLVLTARHIVINNSGSPWTRIESWIGHPADGRRTHCIARVLWDDRDSDLALLRFDSEIKLPDKTIRWGCFIGNKPVQYEGLAFPVFSRYDSAPGLEQLGGYLPPLAIGDNSCYVLDQSVAPVPDGTTQWGGASGAAVFCGDLLVATVAKDDRAFGNQRLHGTRLVDVLSQTNFAGLIAEDTGTWPTVEAVELSEFLKSARRRLTARTPGSLLAADLEAVAFTGRGEILEDLSRWRDSGAQLGVALMVGEGGQGKTRLAQEFVRLTAKHGSIAGFMDTSPPYRNQLNSASNAEIIRLLRMSNRSMLIVADYAETHPDYIENILDGIREGTMHSTIRLLLLSRSVNAWWENISEMLPGEDTRLIALSPLTSTLTGRKALYAAGVVDLAKHLPMLYLDPTDSSAVADWRSIAIKLADNPPDLSDGRLQNALTLLMAALTDLLTVGSGRAPLRADNFEEQELVTHELGYLRRTAVQRGLFEKDVLSRRTDQHDRNREAWGILERAIAGLILLGPTNTDRAHTIGELASPERAVDVSSWLAALYPAVGEYRSIGAMQPDRLAELILGRLLSKQLTLAGDVARHVKNFDGAITLLFILLRTGAHPQFASIRDQARDIILKHPVPFAEAALVLTVNLAHVASIQGSGSAAPALQAILENANSISDPINPEALASAMRMALERLAFPGSASAEPGLPAKALLIASANSGRRPDQAGSLYQELAKGGPLFVQALLDVAMDVIGVGFDEVRHDREPEQTALVSGPSTDYRQLVARTYSSNYQQLVRLAWLLVHNGEMAEEIVQDSFEAVLAAAPRLQDSEKVMLYSRQIIVDRARVFWRNRTITEGIAPLQREDIPSIEDEVLGKLEQSAVVDALRLLPERQREVIVLRYYGDLRDTEIAQIMGISPGAVKSHQARGLVALREIMRNQ